jgi:PAS domain S-box-containing protein
MGSAGSSVEDGADFIHGGGEMGALIRTYDWTATSVGHPSTWPQSLKTALLTILHSRYPMFIWWGPDFINFYNDSYIPMLGNRHPWALGQHAREVWSDIWEDVGPQAEIVLREGKATWNEELLLVMQRYGYTEETYFTFSYSPAFDDDGNVGGVFCAVMEDTKQVLSERRMRCLRQVSAQTTNARTALEACQYSTNTLAAHRRDVSFALIYLFDKDGSARLACSTGLATGSGLAPELIPPGQAQAPWPIEDIRRGRSAVLRGLEELQLPGGDWPEATNTVVVLPFLKGAREMPRGFLVAGASPLREFDNKYGEFFELLAGGVARAIANAEAYQEEKRRAESLAELDHAKTAFFSNVSHEFRTPLTLLLGPLEELLARKSELNPADWAQLDLIHRNGLRLLRLVNTLLDFSRIEAGRTQAAYEPIDLAAFTGNLASVFRAAIERAGMQLVIDCPPLAEPVYVDRDMWEKIVLNLVSNAFKYTMEGRIEVSLRARGEHAVLEVADTGPGIPEDELPRVFERFHRVEGVRARTHEGTGIGLALVQELAKLHKGSVSVRSVVDQGTTFTVEIPFGTAHLPDDRVGRICDTPATPIQPEAYVAEASQWLKPVDSPPAPAAHHATGRILLVDDNADMREYLAGLLAGRYSVETAADGSAALASILENPPDLVLTDIMMPGLNGLDLVRTVRENPRTHTLPVIMLSARAGEEALVEGLQHGADDYLVKPFTAREVLARVAAHLEIGRLRRASENRFRQLFAANVIGVVSGDEENILEANNAFLGILKVTREDLETGKLRWTDFTPPEYREADARCMQELLETGVCKPFEKAFVRSDGSRAPVLIGATLFERDPLRWLAFVTDLTDRKELEKRLFEKQKLESIGMLAGGIAHDFNNLLVGILGNASLLQDLLPERSNLHPFLDDVVKASERAAHLTRQMLAYSGKGRFFLDRVNLSELLQQTRRLLQPSIPSKVLLQYDLKAGLPEVEADAAQMQQVVMNLVLNAAEAIGDTMGSIRVRTGIQNVDRAYIGRELENAEIEPGSYVTIEVRDTGCGMDESVRARIFDPFFTTKFTGRGLGLAAVAGIVRGHKGAIQVSSIPGKGSTFVVLLPVVAEAAPAGTASHPPAEEAHSQGTILLVDDEEVVRRIAKTALERRGYAVLTAESGAEAIDILKKDKDRVGAVILDWSMPGMNGNETLPHLRRVKPDVQVVVSSGYGEAETLRLFEGQPVSGFIQKPYTSQRLGEMIQEVLAKI